MATLTAQENRFSSQSMIFRQNDRPLAESLPQRLLQQPDYLQQSIKIDQPAAPDCLTLAEWSQTATFTPLIQRYSDYLYLDHPDSQAGAVAVGAVVFWSAAATAVDCLAAGVARARLFTRAYPGGVSSAWAHRCLLDCSAGG